MSIVPIMRRNAFVLAIMVALACSREPFRQEPAPSKPSMTQPTTSSASPSRGVSPGSESRDGDLIFHESTSRQSEMVRALTGSKWTHMGVIFSDVSGPVVLEAVSPVRYTPLDDWVARGRNRRYVVKRLRDADVRLTPDVVRKMRAVGAAWLGRPYDLQFRWADDALYCSELAYKLFESGANIRVGRLEHARDMNLADDKVQRAMGTRFAPGRFDPDEPVVTPISMFEDEQLVTVRDE